MATSDAAAEESDDVQDELGLLSTDDKNVLMDEIYSDALGTVISMGFSPDEAKEAIEACGNNANNAVEYLLEGRKAPRSLENSVSTGDKESSQSDDDPLSVLMAQPQFGELRRNWVQNPHTLTTFLQQIRRTNPRLYQAINSDEERFRQMLHEPVGDAIGYGILGGLRSVSATLSSTEYQVIRRLMSLGFAEQRCIQAYVVCERNEELTANLLLSQDDDDHGFS